MSNDHVAEDRAALEALAQARCANATTASVGNWTGRVRRLPVRRPPATATFHKKPRYFRPVFSFRK